jgi:hypothetical protein
VTTSEETRKPKAFNWPVLGPTFVVGICIAGFGVYANIGLHWKDIWQYVFLDIGSGTALTSAFAVLQGKFVKEVRAAVEIQTASIDRRFAEQTNRIEDLEDRVAGVRARRRAASDEMIRTARSSLTSEDISQALIKAMNVNGISHRMRVRATDDLESLRFVVSYEEDSRVVPSPTIVFDAMAVDVGYSMHYPVPWTIGEDIDVFAGHLFDALEKDDFLTDAAHLDLVGVLQRVVDAAELAIRSRAGEIQRRIKGHLIEIIDEDWLISDEGVCSRTSPFFVDKDELWEWKPGLGQATELYPSSPQNVNGDLWDVIIRCAHASIARPPRRKGFS